MDACCSTTAQQSKFRRPLKNDLNLVFSALWEKVGASKKEEDEGGNLFELSVAVSKHFV